MLKLNGKRKKGLVGVDIGCSSVKLLELSQKGGRYKVESYANIALADGVVVDNNILDAEALSNALQEAVDVGNPSADLVAFSLPNAQVIYKTLEMDKDLTDEEREVQIRLDAEQYIPFPLDEVSLDFEILGTNKKQPDQVYVRLVATRTEHVDAITDALIYAGLTPKVADVENLVLERAFSIFSSTLPVSAKLVAVLDVGHTTTNFTVLNHGRVIYTKEQMLGGKQLILDAQYHYGGLSDADATALISDHSGYADYEDAILTPFKKAVLDQTSRALQLFFSSSSYHQVDHMLLAGGVANLTGLAQYLQAELSYRVTVAYPFLNMAFSPQVNVQQFEQDSPALMLALGVALRSFD
ncbi:type IV pilus assembly protein PilM [Acinetobacter rathckeae]|uniref:type IV pilus assembly protein PilM n=1 Tax=Acinetobacter rathckeae TaxID=2605272 RepID=UPI0018A2A0C0|nr:type IV pilus assembly protein PilM [Acinetobacter rathckeae]MBF7688704.1 type IV pilus assembly protein PilM [Acinetobacter rathckeae]MBF7696097.1 type IV pilus assembly protein PilM [Acinetobacter rathckeae]